MSPRVLFIALSAAAILVDLAICIHAVKTKKTDGTLFAGIMAACAVALAGYCISAVTTSYTAMSMASSVYFSFIDVALFLLAIFMLKVTEASTNRVSNVIILVLGAYMVFDMITLLHNPFGEAAISYELTPGAELALWHFAPHALFNMHLFFCYTLIGFIIFIIVHKIAISPSGYKQRYFGSIGGILTIILLNAIFLYLPMLTVDLSVFLYSLMGIYMYWDTYYRSRRQVLNKARVMILQSIGHPVVFFDYRNRMIAWNNDAESLLPGAAYQDMSLMRFLHMTDILDFLDSVDEEQSFIWTSKRGGRITSYRVDYRFLSDEKGRVIGRLLVFTDNTLAIDLLTGFNSHNSFNQALADGSLATGTPTGVVVFDLNKLTNINARHGRSAGDDAIKRLSAAMNEAFPEDTYFARLDEANLLALVPDASVERLRSQIRLVSNIIENDKSAPFRINVQSSMQVVAPDANIDLAVQQIGQSLRTRKLLDKNSRHSSLINSLAQTQHESDGETEAHVERTRLLGERLGERLGLTDLQQSSLALLCLLHDIGKVGIPLEILNKPGKLTAAEWDVMKSHTVKGAEIAKASPELRDISDLILHHHECWDGSGYPDGLARESIPLLSRIISIVDTYDAMTNDRPYRKAMAPSAARDELERCSGTQFDPYLVKEFIAMLDESGEFMESPKVSVDDLTLESDDPAPHSLQERRAEVAGAAGLGILSQSRHVMDTSWNILSVNEEFEHLTGYTQEDVVNYGLTHRDLLFPEDIDAYTAMTSEALKKNQSAFTEHRIRRKDGSSRQVFCYGKDFFDSITREPRAEIIMVDIATSKSIQNVAEVARSSMKHTLELWERNANTDQLTGLINREAYKAQVQTEMDNRERVVLVMLDLDNFKKHNDTYGHPHGDMLIMRAAHALEAACGKKALVGRMGGDEFSACLPISNRMTADEIKVMIESIASQVNTTLLDIDSDVTCSVGYAAAQRGALTFNELYRNADQALYKAKGTGRNRVISFGD